MTTFNAGKLAHERHSCNVTFRWGGGQSSLSVQVTNCSSTVLPVSAQYTALVAQGTASLTFDIFLTSSVADQGLGCVVSLVNTLVSTSIQRAQHDAAMRGMEGILPCCPSPIARVLIPHLRLALPASSFFW